MPPAVASIAFAFLIAGLFWLDRDARARTSVALWVPAVWLFLACSRSVNQWVHGSQAMNGGYIGDLEGNLTDRLVYSGLVVIGLVVLASRGRRIARILHENATILIFFFYCLASLLWSDIPGVAFKRWIKAIGDLVMLLVVLSEREPTTAVKRFITRAGFFLIPLSVLFIKYYPELGKTYGRWTYEAIYTGVTLNKNTLGAVCLLFGLGSVWRFLDAYGEREYANRKRHLIVHGAVIAMALWLFWMADSMTSFSCFVIGACFLVALNSRAIVRRPSIVHLFVVAVLSITAGVLFLDLSPGALADMGRDPTLTARTEIWSIVLRLVPNHLVGAGFESFWQGPRLQTIWAQFPWKPFEAHNGYIEIFVNLGWIGVILLAVVLLTGYRKAVSSYRHNLPMSSLMLTYFVVGLIYNFTEAAFFRMMQPVWIFLLLSMTACLQLSEEPAAGTEQAQVGFYDRLGPPIIRKSVEAK